MSGKYQAYPDYKDSGDSSFGAIPSHWSTKKVNYLFSFGRGLNITKADLEDTGVGCLSYGEVHSKFGFEANPSQHALKCVSSDYLRTSQRSLLTTGDFVFADTSEDIDGAGNFTQFIGEGQLFAGYHTVILRPKVQHDPRFLAYAFDAPESRNQIRLAVKGVKVFSITQEILKNVTLLLPSGIEQRTIAAFLDHETARINRLIEKQQRLIELLKEKRQAVISHAVTKGLDPNVPMKDSGVEWLGQVPEHWVVAGFKKYLASIVDYRGKTPNKTESGVFLVTARNIKNGIVNYSLSQEFISEDEYEEVMRRGKPEVGDVLFTTEAPLGEVAQVDDVSVALAQRIIKFRGQTEVLSNAFLKYFIQSEAFQQGLKTYATGSTALGIKAERLVYLKQLVPPWKEQLRIVEMIEAQMLRIGQVEKSAQQAIALMKERRTALISAAVTGKIDVRNWQPNTSTQSDEPDLPMAAEQAGRYHV
ncbi:restriction endonuclease subunit S [Nitrincola tapanii]|uniref:Restriction endonuclease subunit S n=1 Tax=Nitrincola tapanii TaxID=1708751 RepID=A0A5A9W1T7_9GAMM|nr:restriction endonuclease subunit S [Nitrincola tapanii]KAA0874454.1 restriction endonuclease subunit S [Nitrincola tapanii]